MKSFQDKICDWLTLGGLLAVIGFGSASLLPEQGGKEESLPQAEEKTSMQEVMDTMEELPTMEENPVAEPVVVDTTAEADTLTVQHDADTLISADSVHTHVLKIADAEHTQAGQNIHQEQNSQQQESHTEKAAEKEMQSSESNLFE